MPFLHDAVHHPRKLFLRKAMFQIHLWSGLLVSVYIVIIALSGAVLVFEDELTSTTLPSHLSSYTPNHIATIPAVMQAFHAAYPGARLTDLTTPSPAVPAYQLRAISAANREFTLVADPADASIHPQPYTWVNFVHDLHIYLLLGTAHGEQINGIGAATLLLLCLTGILLWWQGLKTWSRALRLSLRHNWRRINFDAHHAIGIWTLAIVIWWSISGIYFAWYKQVVAAVNSISALKGMISPQLPSHLPSGVERAPLESILAAAQHASPQSRLFDLSDPSLTGTIVYAQMDLRAPGDFSHRDIIALDSTNAHVLTIWHYGQNQSLGDWFIWSMHPLHFGTLWGFGFKIVWFLLGLSLAVLSITGVIMYWNRYLRHQITRKRKPALPRAPAS